MIEWIRLWFAPERLRAIGSTPDYRFSLANERTFLAWMRTALALVGGGIAVAQFLQFGYLRDGIAIALMLLGTFCALRAVSHWIRTEVAMRRREDLPESRFPATLAVSIALGAGVLLGIVAVGGLR
ncbi:MAG: YidH family protein [Micromonosporaceae bacterium]